MLPLDVSDIPSAIVLVKLLMDHVGVFKLGFEFIYSVIARLWDKDPAIAQKAFLDLRALAALVWGLDAFLDGKFGDIPHTVGKASLAVSQMKMAWFNVHASAGTDAIKKAVENRGNSLLFVVTVLTSISGECQSIFGDTPDNKVLKFAEMARGAGADGLILSPRETKMVRQHSEFDGMRLATPGIRAKDAPPDDQGRTMTAGEAIAAGADYLVIGRPILNASDPVVAAQAFTEEIRLAELVA